MPKQFSIKLRSRGFTLVELIVVVGIVVLLVSLLIPMVSKAYKSSVRARIASDLHVLSQGLEAYKLDQHDYPRISPFPAGQGGGAPVDGAILLCWALYAPGPATSNNPTLNPPDGKDGPGFRIRGTSGTAYGPYVTAGALRVGDFDTSMGNNPGLNNARAVFLDRYDHPIYYCPARPNSAAMITSTNGLVSDYSSGQPQPMFDHTYFCQQSQPGNPVIDLHVMAYALGDVNQNGQIDGSETATFTGPYLLWSAGVETGHEVAISLSGRGPDIPIVTGAIVKGYNDPKCYVTNIP